jgi:hypothetical protein
MAERFEVRDMAEALRVRRFPTVTVWNRLEGRPRTQAFDRALRAEVRDALWMLSRQWQLGEFRGDDAGSPFFAKLHVTHAPLTRYRADDGVAEPFEPGVPLEATVERRPPPLMIGGRETALDLRLAMGRQWLKLVAPVGDYRQAFTDAYAIPAPDPTAPSDADRVAHPEVWQTVAAVAGRRMDGGRLYLYLLADPGNHAYDGVAGVAQTDRDAIDEQAGRFLRWCRRLLAQPDGEDAWVPERLEYRFAVASPTADGEKVLTAEEYPGGTLDWHSFDVDRDAESLGTAPEAGPAATTRTLIPVPLEFEGMPASRWWAFEDRRTNFGAIDAATTDLAKLLFVEFGLVYANDWFLVPFALPVGAVATVEGVAVTSVFGERTWIEPAGTGPDDDWQRWSMFTLSVAGTGPQEAERSVLLAPTVPKVQEGSPVEEVLLVRDEMANMVWGVEIVVPAADGAGMPGSEAATEMRAFYVRELAARTGGTSTSELEPVAPARYQVMTGVPENWIPFVPVHVDGSSRETQLQRAAMPRVLEGDPDPPRKVRPCTTLLRTGLDALPPAPYLLHEEEVPRAGARVAQAWQRTRSRDGSVYVWLGARRQTGRGEHSSGLAFDQLIEEGRG